MINIPTKCPSCGHTLIRVVDILYCNSPNCDAKITKKLEHFCKVMKIKGLGLNTIQSLYLYDYKDIYGLTEGAIIDMLGSKKIATKLIQEINNSKLVPLNTVLVSFSIPLIGEVASEKICQVINHITDINQETCKKAGLGPKASQNLLDWLRTEEWKDLPLNYLPDHNKTTKETVCITGKLINFKNRTEAKTFLKSKGFNVVDSVTANTDFLINEEGNNSDKVQKAKKLGIPILTIEQLLER